MVGDEHHHSLELALKTRDTDKASEIIQYRQAYDDEVFAQEVGKPGGKPFGYRMVKICLVRGSGKLYTIYKE